MKTLCKSLALVMAVVLVFSLFGCGGKKRRIIELTLSTEDAEAILRAAGVALPDATETPAANSIVKWFSHYDPFHNYSEDEVINTGFFTFREKYGCEIEWMECADYNTRFTELAQLVLSDNPPDAFQGYKGVIPYYGVTGLFQPVDDYIDYNSKLWEGTRDFCEQYFTLGEKHYVMITEILYDHVCAYNRRVISEYGYEDPAELYSNDEWTWDTFLEYCIDFSDSNDDRYALDGWALGYALLDASGVSIIEKNLDTGLYESRLDDPQLQRAADLLYELSKNECVYPRWNRGWSIRDGTEGAGLKEGKALFSLQGSWAFTGPVDTISNIYGSVTDHELMFVPLPRDPNGDGNYYMETNCNGYAIIMNAKNPEGVALLAACDRFKVIDPTVVSVDIKQKKEIYLWTEEMLDMNDQCLELAQTGHVIMNQSDGFPTNLNKAVDACYRFVETSANAQTWAQIKEANGDKVQYYVDDMNKEIEAFIANGNRPVSNN